MFHITQEHVKCFQGQKKKNTFCKLVGRKKDIVGQRDRFSELKLLKNKFQPLKCHQSIAPMLQLGSENPRARLWVPYLHWIKPYALCSVREVTAIWFYTKGIVVLWLKKWDSRNLYLIPGFLAEVLWTSPNILNFFVLTSPSLISGPHFQPPCLFWLFSL